MNVEDFLEKQFGMEKALVVSRGNEGIEIALKVVKSLTEKKVLLIPDQGGWISYPKIAKKLGFEIRELKTDRGVIILDWLEKNLDGVAAALFTGFAGYYAEQPVDKIIKICKENNVVVVNDVSGCFGSDLCKGDFLVGSFGKGKIVNYGNYGMVCSNFLKKSLQKSVEYDFKLINYVKDANQRLNNLMVLAERVKSELVNFDVFHREKRGVNVIVGYDERVIGYCNKKGYEYVICPKSFKVNEKAISIELKRLDV